MTFAEAVATIKIYIGIIGIKNRRGDYIREFFIAPLDKDRFKEYMTEYRKIRDHGIVSEKLGTTDFQVWVQITDYGLSTFVLLNDFLNTY